MVTCLNPRKSHENSGTSTPVAALSGANDATASVAVGEQVACGYCKYLLQGALLAIEVYDPAAVDVGATVSAAGR